MIIVIILLIAFGIGFLIGLLWKSSDSNLGTLFINIGKEKNTYRIVVDDLENLPKQKKVYLNIKIVSADQDLSDPQK